MKKQQAQVAESCATEVVDCIKQFIDVLRTEFPLTLRSNHQQQQKQVFLFRRMQEREILDKVITLVEKQEQKLGNNILEQILGGSATPSSQEEETERSKLVHQILLPLIQLLTQCYDILDQLPPPKDFQKEKQSSKTRRKKKPPPPIGMLSIQNYTDVACFLEFTVLTNILPMLQENVLISIEDRMRYHLPKSLAGRINRSSLAWGSLQDSSKLSPSQKYKELVQTVYTITNLVSLDRFKPMLLPRHLTDLYAALFQAEQMKCEKVDKEKLYELYTTLGLTPASRMDASIQAKTYQVLLLKGTKAPGWLRKRVSSLLAKLACTNLAAIIQVFCPVKDTSTASQRLGRALATAHSQKALSEQMLGLLQLNYPSNGKIPLHTMAVLETVWAVLNQWSSENIRIHVIEYWENRIMGGKSQNKQTIHATIRQIGTLCSFLPPSNNALKVLEWIPKSNIFGQLVRLASMSSVLACAARDDAKQTLQWISQALYGLKQNTTFVGEEKQVSAQTILVTAWVHSFAPSSWDLNGNTYCIDEQPTAVNSISEKSPPGSQLVSLEIQKNEKSIIDVGSITAIGIKRAQIFFEITSVAPGENSKTRGLHSFIFQLLLRLYLSSSLIAPLPISNYRLVSILFLPMFVENISPEELLFGDKSDDAIGLLSLVKLVLGCVEQRWQNQPSNLVEELTDDNALNKEEVSVRCLVELSKTIGVGHQSEDTPSLLPDTPSLLPENNSNEDETTLLSIASIILSLLISVLELGSKLRSIQEEKMIQSFLPTLQILAKLKTGETSSDFSPSEESQAGLADMSGYAMALIASRCVSTEEELEPKKIGLAPLSTMEKLKQILGLAEKDLGSTEPPIRARGMVKLGRVARGYLGIIAEERLTKEESAPLITEMKEDGPASREGDTIGFLVQEVLRLSISTLLDKESYVYLAAIQTIVAVGDMRPKEVIPIVASTVVSGKVPSQTHVTQSLPSDIEVSQEQRIKLAEALIFIIRRRATVDEFVPLLLSMMTFGSTERMRSIGFTNVDATNDTQKETHKYFLGMDEKAEEDEQATQKEIWEEQDIRLKTGGPMFKLEEFDIVRSARASVLAELVAMSRPSTLASHCKFLVQLAIDALTLDSSRTVCRSVALLVRELYGRLLCEVEEMIDVVKNFSNLQTEASIPLTVALVAADEELLCSTLQAHASGTSDVGQPRVNDPATSVRCNEALNLRQQAEESGILAASRLFLSQGKRQGTLDLLNIVGTNQGQSGIHIEKLL